MKKIYLAIALFVGLNVSMAQTKSSGIVTLNGLMTLKIDKNATTSTITVTLTGPDNKWFGIGFNATGMTPGTDCLYYATSFVDSKITGTQAPVADSGATEWAVSNTTSGTTRTLVLTRGFAGGTGDYTFSYADNALNIIWAYGNSNVLAYHQSRNTAALTFTVLGIEDFTSLDKIAIAPNPSNGIFTISKNNQTTISKVTIFDINGKVVKVVDSELNFDTTTVDLSTFSKGIYFMEITNETDKVVRKIILE
ncbi:Secretion system C-terminal sorting domain [Flavobacteriaceae bacterium]